MPENANNELNYVTANRFYVEIDSSIQASFTECSGLGMTIDKDVYFEGGVNDQQRIFLKQTKFNDVTLKRGITDNFIFLRWIYEVLKTTVAKRLDVNILLFSQAGETMQTWTLIGAIPVGWKAPSLQANSNTVAIEELTLAYEGLKIKYFGSKKGDIVYPPPKEQNSGGTSKSTVGLTRDKKGFFGSTELNEK